ncbi:hypothetical protein pZL12.69 [Streptomyces phage ZL12]|uniref:Uncharacterized protein n=1 Tax=Streptomyces phage ZL12 TaxID=2570911 RepID=D0UWH4_9CAUD|nr:hypothetical protein QEH43_gp069 [Streptomyces phage ZL12]ACX71146.1 hypothetical protein pZL12.69 [Streptomyces phage ZL12]
MWGFSFPLPGLAGILRRMRAMRGVGAVAAGLAAVVLVSGCGGDGGDGKPAAAVSSPEVVPSTVPPVTEDPEPVYAAGPEGDIDRMADEKGWIVDDLYGSASEFVRDICDSLPVSAVDGASRPQWLAESGMLEGSGEAMLLAGVPKLCPKWTKAVKEAVSGDYERWFGNGTYVVSSKQPTAEQLEEDEDLVTIPPGTYRASGRVEDCYWERTSEGGDIIDNNFATSARSITVTIASSDGQFTSERCAVWKPVG